MFIKNNEIINKRHNSPTSQTQKDNQSLSRRFRKGLRFSLKLRLRLKKRSHHNTHLSSNLLLSSKGLFALIPLLLLPYSFNAQAVLSAMTNKTIQGTAPYFVRDGIKVTDLRGLLSIKIDGKTYISDEKGTMQEVGDSGSLTPVTAPIALSNTDILASVSALVPVDGKAHELNDSSVIPSESRKDDDGDGNISLTGNMKGVWKDNDGKTITSITDSGNVCNYSTPYTLTLTAADGPSISTRYGDPNKYPYGNGTAVFKINSASAPVVCFAKPGSMTSLGDTSPTIWDAKNGFLPQSTESASYGSNFPTTGSNNLYFDLVIGGASGPLTWEPVTNGGITATMTPDNTGRVVRVTLTGPAATVSQQNNATPGSIEKPILPAQLVLEGKANGKTVVAYGFNIQQWFVSRGSLPQPNNSHTNWCKNIGYEMPATSDLTNAVWGGAPSGKPESDENGIARYIGAGLMAEWGTVPDYKRADYYGDFWTSSVQVTNNGTMYVVDHLFGAISWKEPSSVNYGVCVYRGPLRKRP